MKKILVTGSSGFIGKNLVASLRSNGYTVIEADKKIGLDLSNLDVINNLPDVDIVFHAAAYNGTKFFYQRPFDVIRDNILPTQYLLERYAGQCERFVFTGTCESYAGAVDRFNYPVPTNESVPLVVSDVTNPRWSYGGSKIAGELMCVAANKQFDQSYTIIRYHNVYGPDQVDHFIPEFVSRVKTGNMELFGGTDTRSFMFIDDAIDATVKILQSQETLNKIVNVGVAKESTIQEVAELMLNILKIDKPLIHLDSPPGSVKRRSPDVSFLKNVVGFTERVSLAEGIRSTIEKL